MIKTDASKFGRVITAMVTPFDADLKVDYAATEKLVAHLVATGTSAIVVAGTTGESPTLEGAEKRDLLKCVLDAAAGKVKVIMGTGSNSTLKTQRACEEAERAGAHGLLVVAPYYNKPSQIGLKEHFSAAAKSTSLPIIVYNIPGRTGVNIATDTLLEIIDANRNIHALKDSTGNVDQAAEIAGKAREDFLIYSGDDYLTLPFLSVGACGIISVASHLIGDQIKEMIDAFFAGDLDRSRALHYKHLPVFKGLFAAPNPTCVKYMLSKREMCGEHLRLPLVALDAEQRVQMDFLYKKSELALKSTVA